MPAIISTDSYITTSWELVPEKSGSDIFERSPSGWGSDPRSEPAGLIGKTRAETTIKSIEGTSVTLAVDFHWIEDEDGFRITDVTTPTKDVFILDPDEIEMYQMGEEDVLDHRSFVELATERGGTIEDDVLGVYSDEDLLYAADAYAIYRHAAALQPGHIVTDIDLGKEGAAVVSVDGDKLKLVRLDTEEIVTVDLGKADLHAHEPVEPEGIGNSLYDEDAMDSPELHNIRSLPTYWGPRDPNNPSTLTDVSWRPEPYWRRRRHRYYHFEEPTKMPRYRRPERRAEPLPSMSPLPHAEELDQPIKTDYGLPRRMQLQKWEESDDHELDKQTLIDLVANFWKGYRQKRTEHLPEIGSHKSLDLVDWALIFQKRHDLDFDEMVLLLDFMATTELIPEAEKDRFVDMFDAYAVHRYDQL
jgi:hypothetical protein